MTVKFYNSLDLTYFLVRTLFLIKLAKNEEVAIVGKSLAIQARKITKVGV